MGWKTVMKQQKLVEKMTIEEKAAILSGKTVWQTREIDRLSIPSIFLSDGPHGIRKQAGAGDHLGLNASLNATCFPTAATIANSWNQDLGEEIGQALGEEAASMDVNILLGPGLNIKRSPLCGRNFEYFSEDPYLSGKMAASYIRGIQSKGVYACPKHLAVNSQELRRMAMDAVVDERTLREIYLTGFEIAVKEGHAKAIMSSYNQINGIYANEDKHLLTDILRKDWGFDAKGNVIYDWPPKLGFDESTIKSISRTDSLPDTWDRYGYMGGSNFADVPPTGKYTYSERAIPYVENEAAYHTGAFNNATYFDKIDAIKNGDIDGLNTILSREGIANVDSSYFKNLQNTYNDFIEDTANAVGSNIDATYGLKGTAASWGDMSGGAGQYVTPLNGSTMKRLGIIN